jgi:2',3'-cyclic-nucleotide 2'-phosphodiesterase (5'-nucleotidase family)
MSRGSIAVPRARQLAVAVLLGLLSACAAPGPKAPVTPPVDLRHPAERTAVLLTINDIYRIEGVEEGKAGGLARVRALRLELERTHPDLLLLHAGDLLFPSFASRTYSGQQMIAVLDGLDGDPAAFDPRMIAVFGNHEFEKLKLKDAGILAGRVHESQFRWLAGNVDFKKGSDGQPLIGGDNLSRSVLVESGGIKIGIFGLTIPMQGVEYVDDFRGPDAAARDLTAALRAQGAEVVVALTHLNASDDRQLLETLRDAGPDLIVGAHHHAHLAFQAGGRWVFNADADARTANVLRLTLGAGGLRVENELRPLSGEAPRPDPQLQARVDEWQTKHEQAFCQQAGAGSGCLKEVYGRTRTVLEAEETKIRSREASLGDWVTDRMVAAFAACGAQAAFINSGSLRLNQDLDAGTQITRRHVEELFAYPTPLYLLRLDGATLEKVAAQAARGWPGSGSWLQIAGWAYVHDQEARSANGVTLLTARGQRPISPAEPVLVVTNDYVINPEIGDQDGYTMLSRDQIVASCAANGQDLKEIVVRDLKAAEPDGIAPVTQGRICQPGTPCLAFAVR